MLFGQRGARLIDAVLRVAVDVFSLRPRITSQQFTSQGFLIPKVGLVADIAAHVHEFDTTAERMARTSNKVVPPYVRRSSSRPRPRPSAARKQVTANRTGQARRRLSDNDGAEEVEDASEKGNVGGSGPRRRGVSSAVGESKIAPEHELLSQSQLGWGDDDDDDNDNDNENDNEGSLQQDTVPRPSMRMDFGTSDPSDHAMPWWPQRGPHPDVVPMAKQSVAARAADTPDVWAIASSDVSASTPAADDSSSSEEDEATDELGGPRIRAGTTSVKQHPTTSTVKSLHASASDPTNEMDEMRGREERAGTWHVDVQLLETRLRRSTEETYVVLERSDELLRRARRLARQW